MNRWGDRWRRKPKEQEPGGFKFAVTLLAFLFGSVLWLYGYLQNNPVDIFWYGFACVLVAVVAILAIGLLLYLLIKGYSMEVRDPTQKECLEKRASHIYLGTFLMTTMLLMCNVVVFISAYLQIEIIRPISVLIVITLICLVNITFCLTPPKGNRHSKNILDALVSMKTNIFLVGLLLWTAIFPPLLDFSPLQGHVTIEMDDIYYKNNAPIPVLIQVTGPNTGLSVSLSKEESGYNLTLIDSIRYLEPEHNKTMVVSGENSFLCGNALDYGKYSVFIKATNLSPGYYELVCVRPKYSKVYGVKGFYLLNKS